MAGFLVPPSDILSHVNASSSGEAVLLTLEQSLCDVWNGSLPIHNTIAVLWILTLVQIVCLVVGVLGNILAFIILVNTARYSNADLYLAVLAISDIFSIMFSNFGMYLALYFRGMAAYHGWKLDAFFFAKWNQMPWCALRIYLGFYSRTVSIWLIMVFTVERTIIVKKPFLAKMFTRRTAILAIVLLTAVAGFFNLAYLWSFEVKTVSKGGPARTMCVLSKRFLYFNSVDVLMLMVLPVVVICACNCLIVKEISKRKLNNWLKSVTKHSTRSHKKAALKRGTKTHSRKNACTAAKKVADAKREAMENRVTKRLILVSTTLVIFTVPMVIYSVSRNVQGLAVCFTAIFKPPWSDLMAFNIIFYNMTFSTNYILYSLVEKSFQRKALYLISCEWQEFRTLVSKELVVSGVKASVPTPTYVKMRRSSARQSRQMRRSRRIVSTLMQKDSSNPTVNATVTTPLLDTHNTLHSQMNTSFSTIPEPSVLHQIISVAEELENLISEEFPEKIPNGDSKPLPEIMEVEIMHSVPREANETADGLPLEPIRL